MSQSVLGFATCSLLLAAYLVSLTARPLPLPVYWIPFLSAITIVAWQSTQVLHRRNWIPVILGEVVALGLLGHLLFVIPVQAGVFGRDVFSDLAATRNIEAFGWPIPSLAPIAPLTRSVSDWPLLEFLGIMESQITGTPIFSITDPNNVLRWFPSVLSLVVPLIWYSIAQRIYHRPDISILASLASTLVFYNTMFHSWFVQETLGYVLLFSFVLCFIVPHVAKRSNLRWHGLSLVFLIALGFAHHLTFVFALLFLVVVLLIPKIVAVWTLVRQPAGSPSRVNSPSGSGLMLLLSTVVFVAYLSYIGEPILRTLVNSLADLLQPAVVISVRSYGPAISSDRVLLVIRLVFAVFFTYALLLRAAHRNVTLFWDLFGLLWGASTAGLMVATQSLVRGATPGVLRVEAFAWPLLIIPTSHAVMEAKGVRVLALVLTLFVVVNIVMIPPYVYDPAAQPQYGIGEVSLRYNTTDYAAAMWFTGNGTVLGDVTVFELFDKWMQHNVVTDLSIYSGNLSTIDQYQWMVVRSEDTHVVVSSTGTGQVTSVSSQTQAAFDASPALSSVYDNGNVRIYAIFAP